MSYKNLLNEIRIDLIEGRVITRDLLDESQTIEIGDDDGVATYRRGWRRVERWEGNVRTHVFRVKIPAHKWVAVIYDTFKKLKAEKPDTSVYDELAASGNYSDEDLAAMRAEWGIP